MPTRRYFTGDVSKVRVERGEAEALDDREVMRQSREATGVPTTPAPGVATTPVRFGKGYTEEDRKKHAAALEAALRNRKP